MSSSVELRDGSTSPWPQLSVNGSARTLSRSPHPYHRRSTSLLDKPGVTNEAQAESSDSTESEERGTEADDEKGLILKALPAPPLHGRKGLKGSKTPADLTPSISPLATPPALVDNHGSYFQVRKTRKGSKTQARAQNDHAETYLKHVKRRRVEVVRRATELALLTSIGAVACADSLRPGKIEQWYWSLLATSFILVLFSLSHPVRTVLHGYRNDLHLAAAVKAGFHIPSRFDPGSVLYPVFLPFFISASLSQTHPFLILVNIILGISSVPPTVVPFTVDSNIHWLASLLPAFGHTLVSTSRHRKLASWSCFQASTLESEDLALLFPLHQATQATVKYLISTSLDPAEVQLLTSGLINLYVFASSPQAQILKGMLWLGALCLFIFCQKALSWEVDLARIPAWKFVRNKSPKTGILGAFERIMKFFISQRRHNPTAYLNSDDEDYDHLKSARRKVKNQARLRKTRSNDTRLTTELPINGKSQPTELYELGLRRSATVSVANPTASSPLHRRKRSLVTSNSGFLSLTFAQAQACKWLISIHVLIAVVIIILGLIRPYVAAEALSSHEPFGWAAGYLFGNLQPLRFWIVSNNLDGWISLPQHVSQQVPSDGYGWLEHQRQTWLGPANTRLALAAYCLLVLGLGIGTVLQLGTVVEVDTRRKVFHGIMVAMLLPTVFIDPCFIALALSLILAIFLLLDTFRASQLPPISKPLTTFLAPYVDGRDYRGPVIVSHIFLLIGCAIPLWLSLAAVSRTGKDPWSGWETDQRELGMISGVVCVGMGDAAASLIGRRYGRTKWFWGGGKSLEGSLAFAVAVTIGLMAGYVWLRIGGWLEWKQGEVASALVKAALAGTAASGLESVLTAGNDNVIVPVSLWLLVRGLNV